MVKVIVSVVILKNKYKILNPFYLDRGFNKYINATALIAFLGEPSIILSE